ncbi:MAG: LPS export ABC transporter periplasmic protein LptC [Treponema sp.]|nr:LPS export ABC transporter periplasmic protein LptC [Treponema sp.]
MKTRRIIIPAIFIVSAFLSAACSFDYGNTKAGSDKPDIVMRDLEYVRVRGGDPLVQFKADYAERYEEKKMMNLQDFSFEQFENHGSQINATGSAGNASVETDSGNLELGGGVKIAVESEDITIETNSLQWKDKEKILTAPDEGRVDIQKSDGTSFTGSGFSANAREKTWVFNSGAEGSYYDDNNGNASPDVTSAPDETTAADETAAAPDETTAPDAAPDEITAPDNAAAPDNIVAPVTSEAAD